MNTTVHNLLRPERLTDIVDIGANPIDGDPPYKTMLEAGLCRVTGFEPHHEALLELQQKQGPYERYLPDAVGDGQTHTLNICHASGMTSLFEPDPAILGPLGLFEYFGSISDITERVPLVTRKLDDISEIEHLDFLKIDIQGGELAVFRNGQATLAHTVAIQTEISFITLYKDQPSLGEVDQELRSQGFIPHCFTAIKNWPITPCLVGDNPYQAINQLLEADIVYVRDFAHPETMSDEQLKHLALIAHHCYQSFDLTLRCIMLLEQRSAIEAGTQKRYLDTIPGYGTTS